MEESWLPHGLYQMVLTVSMNSLVSTYGMSSVALFNVVALLFNVFALLFNKYILSFNVCAFIFNIYNCHSMHFHLYSMYPIII